MRLLTPRRSRRAAPPGVTGPARLDRRTRNLLSRLRPGDVAVLEHVDLDRASAEQLARSGVAAVVNVAPSISGRFPNLGPQLLLDAGIPVLDGVGADIFTVLDEGDRVRLDADTLYRGDTAVASGRRLDPESVATAMEQARGGLAAQLEALNVGATEYLRREHRLLLDDEGVPEIRTELAGRVVLVVSRAYDYRVELEMLRGFVRERRPVLLGVGGGADALLEAGYQPDLIVGGLDGVSDQALHSGAEVVVQAGPDGYAPERARLERLGIRATVFSASGGSEDLALLLADAKGATVVVTAGSPATLPEILDRGRSEAASAVWTRVRVAPRLLDAATASRQLYQRQVATWQLIVLLLAGLLAVAVAVATTPVGQSWLDSLAAWWAGLTSAIGGPDR